MADKICNKCKSKKDIDEFDLHPLGKGGRHPNCKKCRSDYEKERYLQKTEEDRQHRRDSLREIKYVKRFGKHKITPAMFLERVAEQNRKCAICGKEDGNDLVIDHCHKRNKIRQLLCRNCNTGLGMFGDDIERLENAIKYLVAHGESVELERYTGLLNQPT